MDKEQLIAQYFLNSLTDKDQKFFDDYYNSDSEFKAEVDFQKTVRQSIYQKEHNALKSQLQEVESHISREKSSHKWWLVAASLVLFACMAYFLTKDNVVTPTELYAEYYTPANNIVHPIVRNGNAADKKTLAFINYQKGNYKLAYEQFIDLHKTNKESELLFYEGICLLEIDKTELAIEKFKAHLSYKDAVSNRTTWYLALAYLKNDSIDNANKLLDVEAANEQSFKQKEARNLLKKLESLSEKE